MAKTEHFRTKPNKIEQFCPLTISEDTAIDLYKNHVWDDMQYVEQDRHNEE